MAVFTLDDRMGGPVDALCLVRMAGRTVFFALIFDRNFLPVLYIAIPVPSVHVSPFMYTEILWHIEGPNDKDNDDKADDNQEWPEDMIIHPVHLPVALRLLYCKFLWPDLYFLSPARNPVYLISGTISDPGIHDRSRTPSLPARELSSTGAAYGSSCT